MYHHTTMFDKTILNLDDLIHLKMLAKKLKLQQTISDYGSTNAILRGRGMEFQESRHYLPGDEIRHMDWRVTARTGRPHTKVFLEEHDYKAYFYCHLSESLYFGSKTSFKSVAAIRAAALVAWRYSLARYHIGGLWQGNLSDTPYDSQQSDVQGDISSKSLNFRDKAHEAEYVRLYKENKYTDVNRPEKALNFERSGRLSELKILPAQAGQKSLMQLFNHWLKCNNSRQANTIAWPILVKQLPLLLEKKIKLLVFSDFYEMEWVEPLLKSLAQNRQIILIHVYDLLEASLPPPNLYTIEHHGQRFSFVSDQHKMNDAYQQQFVAKQNAIKEWCCKYHAGYVSLSASDFLEPLSTLFW